MMPEDGFDDRGRKVPSRVDPLSPISSCVLPIWLMIRIGRNDSRLAKSFRPPLSARRPPAAACALQLSNLLKCLERRQIWRWLWKVERQCSVRHHRISAAHKKKRYHSHCCNAFLRCIQCHVNPMRPWHCMHRTKTILVQQDWGSSI